MTFKLETGFIKRFVGQEPRWGPLGYVTYKRTYAREIVFLPERYQALATDAGLKKTEEFWLTLTRVVEGTYRIQEWHCSNLRIPWDSGKAQRSAQEMFRRMWDFKFLPPGRGLFMMGSGVEWNTSAVLQNCAFISTKQLASDPTKPFAFLMDMSMLGAGVGSDVFGANKVKVYNPIMNEGSCIVVEDSRAGWVNTLKSVIHSYTTQNAILDLFDFSQIREKGMPLKSFGGTSSGAEPLIKLVKSLTALFNRRIGSYLTSEDIVDVFNLIGKCVVSGNVRRSSEIMLGPVSDKSFLNLKNPNIESNKIPLASHRWASNNSVFGDVGMNYSAIAEAIAANGEPGVFWLENAQAYSRMNDTRDWKDQRVMGTNPCSEQSLESGEMCNLVETFPANHDSIEDWQHTLKFAYLYAKTVTLLPTHNVETNQIMMRNRRIGLSMSGICQAINKFGRRKFLNGCAVGYDLVREWDMVYSRWFAVPESIKVTSVKPSGTVSLLCGAWPGIHLPEAEYYNRVIRFANDSWMLPWLQAQGFKMYDLSGTGEPNTTAVYFPVRENFFSKGKREVTLWEQLENAAVIQSVWADNQVSCTVTFKPEERRDIVTALELYETRLKSISFLPYQTHGYSHAPYQEISEHEFLATRRDIVYNLESHGIERMDAYCDSDQCYIQ